MTISLDKFGGVPDEPERPKAVRRPPRWEDALKRFTSGEREPVIATWLRNPETRRARAAGMAQFAWHRVAFHGVRSPIYVFLFAGWALRGTWRGVRRTYEYVTDEEARGRARDADNATYLQITDRKDRHVMPRLQWVGFLTVVAIVALVAARVYLPHVVTHAVGAAGFVAAVKAGAPRGRPMFKAAVSSAASLVVTQSGVVDALNKLGIPDLNKAIRENPDTAVRFPGVGIARDHVGRGTLVRCDLPLGCTAASVINKRANLASAFGLPLGRVWLTTDPLEAPSHLEIWLPDISMNRRKVPAWPYLNPAKTADYFEPFDVGWDQMNRPVTVLLDQSGSIFAGQSGFGKTSGSAVVLYYSALDPTVEHWVLDLGGKGDWRDVKAFASRFVAGQDDEHIEAGLQMLRDLRQEIRKRAAILDALPPEVRGPEVRVTRDTANKIPGLHPLVFFGDEIQELFGHEDPEAAKGGLSRISKEARKLAADCSKLGRALGVHIELATQEPTQAVFPVSLRRNLRIRVLYRVTAEATDRIVLGDEAADWGVTSTQFTIIDQGISNVAGSTSHAMSPATVCQWAKLDGPARAGLALRARALREAAGMLRGQAAGIEPVSEPVVPLRDFLNDAYAVTLGRKKVWTKNLLALLEAAWPGRYQDWTAEQLASAFRPFEISSDDVHDSPLEGGRGSTAKGYHVDQIRAAHLQREQAEQGEDGDEEE